MDGQPPDDPLIPFDISYQMPTSSLQQIPIAAWDENLVAQSEYTPYFVEPSAFPGALPTGRRRFRTVQGA